MFLSLPWRPPNTAPIAPSYKEAHVHRLFTAFFLPPSLHCSLYSVNIKLPNRKRTAPRRLEKNLFSNSSSSQWHYSCPGLIINPPVSSPSTDKRLQWRHGGWVGRTNEYWEEILYRSILCSSFIVRFYVRSVQFWFYSIVIVFVLCHFPLKSTIHQLMCRF